MTKYCVFNEKNEVGSSFFDTYEEAVRELEQENEHQYGDGAQVVEVDD